MKEIERSIKELDQLLTSKGYTQLFTIEDRGTDKFVPLLTELMDAAARDPMVQMLPVKVHTITDLPQILPYYKRCVFTMDFTSGEGLKITGAEGQCVSRFSGKVMSTCVIPKVHTKGFPDRRELNSALDFDKKNLKKGRNRRI